MLVEGVKVKVLFFLSIGLDRQATSGHLINAMIEALCKDGNSVHIIQKDTGGSLPSIPEGLSKYPVTTDCIQFRAANKGNFIARYLNELKYIRAAQRKIGSEYDAVFIQSTTVAGFTVRAIRKRLPNSIVTINVQDIFPYNLACTGGLKTDSLIFKALAAVQRYGYKHSDHIITISEDMKETLVQDGSPMEKVKVIYNWSYQDEPYENIDIAKVSHMFSSDYFNIVYAGNIGIMQNVEIIIEAAKLMRTDKSVWFHIIGDGVYKNKLEDMAKEYQIENISFWPMQPSELAPMIYSAADINVIPLVKGVYRTALPSKTATCLACQKPIIFAIGKESRFGIKMVKETNCALIESDDPKSLVEAIYLIKGRRVTSANFRELYLQNFSVSRNSDLYSKTITTRSN